MTDIIIIGAGPAGMTAPRFMRAVPPKASLCSRR